MRRRKNPIPDGVLLFGAIAFTALGVVLLNDALKARKTAELAAAPAPDPPWPNFTPAIPGYGPVI